LARAVLTEEEFDYWSAMEAGQHRKTEWLLGRLAMKDAVRSWAIQRYQHGVAPRAVRIETTSAGAPFIVCSELGELGPLPAVSLAHCPTLVLAAAGDPGRALGVDVESRDRNVTTLARALTPEELALTSDAGSYGVSVLDVVVAKEAAAKALGIGLGGSLTRWPVADADLQGRRLFVQAPEPHPQVVPVDLVRRSGVVVGLAQCDLDHL
jgi:phosphopantetheinyl transferase (holo-ACP synthase)